MGLCFFRLDFVPLCELWGVSFLIKLIVLTFLLGFTSYSFRSSRLQMIFKEAVRKNLAKWKGKHLWWSSLSLKLETVTLRLENSIREWNFPVKFDIGLWNFTSILKAITALFLLHFDIYFAEAMIIWLNKQMSTLSNQSFRGVFVKLFDQKKPEVSYENLSGGFRF